MTANLFTLHERHRILSRHRCSCGWEGDSATTHIIDTLGLEQVATGKFGLWEWSDGTFGWSGDVHTSGIAKRVPVYRLRGVENGSEAPS